MLRELSLFHRILILAFVGCHVAQFFVTLVLMPNILASKSVVSFILSVFVLIGTSAGGIMKLTLFLNRVEYVTLMEMILTFDSRQDVQTSN